MSISIFLHTPLHIGDGEKLEPISFFEENENISIINQENFFKILALKRGNIDSFTNWIEMELKKDIKHNRPNLNIFLKENPLIKKELLKDENILYKIKGNSKKSISTVIKENNKLYIPGSEIKGAIRTAVFYKRLKEDENIYKELEKEIKKLEAKFSHEIDTIKDLKKPDKKNSAVIIKEIAKITKKIENLAFNYDKSEKKDAKYDIFKHLMVRDSELREINENILEVKNLKTIGTFAPDSAEFIKRGKIFKTDIIIAPKKIIEKNKTEKLNYLEWNYIKEALHDYAKSIIEIDKEYFSNNKMEKEFETKEVELNKIKDKLTELELMNSKENPLIRIGKYKGYISNTISLIVRYKNEKLYDEVLAHCTKGTSYTKKNNASFNNLFPKTRRLAIENEFFGWCQLVCNKKEFEEKKEIAKNKITLSNTNSIESKNLPKKENPLKIDEFLKKNEIIRKLGIDAQKKIYENYLKEFNKK